MTSFAKLKSGDWGIKADGAVTAGQTLAVRKKDGTTSTVTVAKVVWTDGKVSLCAIVPQRRDNGGSSGGREVCAECGRGGRLVEDLEDGLAKHYNCCDIPPG